MSKPMFTLKIRSPGASSFETYAGNDGKIVQKKIAGGIESMALAVQGMKVAETAETQRARMCYIAAVFFQRVISRTPVDEDYFRVDKKGETSFHKADDDAVRYSWAASYNNARVTARQLADRGLSFDVFNDKGEIDEIYNIFLQKFGRQKSRLLRQIHIENSHPRFAMLEYGEYYHDTGVVGKGKYEHGVTGGFSVQAPAGMLRVTEAQFKSTALNMSTERLIRRYVSASQRLMKIPSKSALARLKSIMGKGRLTGDDIEQVEEIMK